MHSTVAVLGGHTSIFSHAGDTGVWQGQQEPPALPAQWSAVWPSRGSVHALRLQLTVCLLGADPPSQGQENLDTGAEVQVQEPKVRRLRIKGQRLCQMPVNIGYYN